MRVTWRIFLGLFALVLGLGLVVPLYTDEVGSKLQLSRVFAEGGNVVALAPQCRSVFVLPVPAAWYPAAALYAALFGHAGLLALKLSGIVVAGAWLVLAASLLRRVASSSAPRLVVTFVALHAFGVLPLMLTMARGEGTLLVCVALLVAFPTVRAFESRKTAVGRALVTAAFVLVTSVFFYTHSKTLFYAPFVLASAALTFPRRRPLALALAIGFAFFAIGSTYARASQTSRCPEAPSIDAVFARLTLSPSLARTSPGTFLTSGLHDVVENTRRLATTTSLEAEYPGTWLPSAVAPLPRVAGAVNLATHVVVIGLAPLATIAAVLALVLARGERRRTAWLVVAMLAGLGAHLFFVTFWPFYNTPFATPQLALALCLSVPVLADRLRRSALRRAAASLDAALLAAAAVSLVVTAVQLGPVLVARAARGGTVQSGQPASVGAFGYPAERTKIRGLAARCGIAGDAAEHLVVDDATYFAFDDLKQPLPLIYVTDASMWGLDMPGEKDVAFLRSMRARGIISRCDFFPTALISKTRREGGYCCVGRDALDAP